MINENENEDDNKQYFHKQKSMKVTFNQLFLNKKALK